MSVWRETRNQVPPYDQAVWARTSEHQRPFKAARILHRSLRCGVWVRKRGRRGLVILHKPPALWAGIGKGGEPIDPGPPPPPDPLPPAFFKSVERSSIVRALDEGLEPRDWWRDGLFRYSPPGAVTPREAEGRVMRCLLTCSVVKLENPRGSGSNSDWIARQIERVRRENGERPTYWHARFQPTARDLSDCEIVLGWVAGLWLFDDRYYTVLRMRAVDPPYSWVQIGGVLCLSASSARRIYKQAIDFAVRRANRVETRQCSKHAAAQTVSA